MGKHTYVGLGKHLPETPQPTSVLLDHNLRKDASPNARRRRRRRQWGDQAPIDDELPEPGPKDLKS